MKKILIIEDDLDIQELIQFFLEDQGYEVITASDGIDGIAVFLKEQIDLILLDILLPKMDGYAVCELIRKESEVPIIMISALGREEDQIKGFEMQIDDYIPKPISLPIMIKKIEAVLRRYEGVDITKDHELKYREIILIVGNYQVKIGKKLIDLTQKEYEILKELIENQGCVITRESFLNRLSVVGCSNKNFDSKVTGDNQTTTENVSDILNDQEKKEGGYENESSSNADDKENSADDSEVLANADLRGAVLEFSDTGCNISIGTQTDDAEMVPAPGAVVEEMNQVKIVYGENTYFQISHSTMTGITLEDCRKEEVKKQSMLYLYGDYQEDGTFLAKRVIIDRFEKEGEWE